jgi:hypothetical protein
MNLRPLILPFILSATAATVTAQSPPAASSNRPPIPPPPASGTAASAPDAARRDLVEYLDRISKLKDDDVDGRLTLARWARDRKMWGQAQEMADQALYRDPGNRAAYTILQQVDDARPLPEEPEAEAALQDEMLRRFGHAFKTRNSKHFIIAYDTTEAYAVQRGVSMEKAYDAFQFYFNMNKLRPEFLEHRLVMILLQNREDYLAYGRQTERTDLSWSGGFYSNRTNRSIFFDDASAPSNASFAKQAADLKTQIDSLNTSIAEAGGKGQSGQVNMLTLERNRANESLFQINNRIASNAQIQNNARTMHEAAHQISFNMGIQVRNVDYPFWFSEGLACSFEVEDAAGHRGPALVNFGRVPPLKDALKDDKLIPLELIITTNPESTAENKSLLLFYSESWALFHYLYKFDRNAMEQYITAYKAHMPLRAISADERKVMFTRAFGSDLEALSKKWVAYLKSLPGKAN